MHRDCTPTIAFYAQGQKFVCQGGFDPPHQHDRLWVKLPPGFIEPSTPEGMAALHDKLLAMFPCGGHHTWRQVEDTEPTAMTRFTVAVPLAGELADALNTYCAKGHNRVEFIRSLLHTILIEPDAHMALANFEGWRKLVRKP